MDKIRSGLIIGITGGIGTGKSSAARLLAGFAGAFLLDADEVVRGQLEPGQKGWSALRLTIGASFFNSDDSLDKPLLRKSIFHDSALRAQVETTLHPIVREEVERHIALKRKEQGDLVVEVPLLYEAGWQDLFDRVVVVGADEDISIRRIMNRDRVGLEDARAALEVQMPLKLKMQYADHVVINNGSIAALQEEVRKVFEALFC